MKRTAVTEIHSALHDLELWLDGAGADADQDAITRRIERAANAFQAAAEAAAHLGERTLSRKIQLDVSAAVAKFEGLLAAADARRAA